MLTPLNSSSAELWIRRARREDIPGILQLLRLCIDDMRRQGIDQWDDVYPTRENFKSDLASSSLYVVGFEGESILGAMTVNQHQDAEYAGASWSIPAARVAVVHRLMVDPASRGRGLARRLMEFAEDFAAAQGCDAMRLDAFALNPRALRLYHGLGYQEAGEITFRKGSFVCFEKRLRPQAW